MKISNEVDKLIEDNCLFDGNLYQLDVEYKDGSTDVFYVYYSDKELPAFINIYNSREIFTLSRIVKKGYILKVSRAFLIVNIDADDIRQSMKKKFFEICENYSKLQALCNEQMEEIERLNLICALIPNFEAKGFQNNLIMDEVGNDEVTDDEQEN